VSTTLTVPEALAGTRLDRALAQLLDVSVGTARRVLARDLVRVDGRRPHKGDAVAKGAIVDVAVARLDEAGVAWLVGEASEASEALLLAILFVDDDVIIVDKPAGMPCHPLVPGEGGTAVDALIGRHPEIANASEEPREAGLVHRIDTGTSGCLAVARTRASWARLREAFANPAAVAKRYLAVVEGAVAGPLVLDGGIAHDERDSRRMRLARDGKPAVTRARPLATAARASLVLVDAAEGGRRHQVRVHLAGAGHPLVGDVLYGAAPAVDAPWHLLHALSLELPGKPRVDAQISSAFAKAASARGLVVPSGAI
jgi:23S rRNA pseudouridine1911/1915/1917 synthase